MKILIVGAGIAGLTLADLLLRDGNSVHIIEKSPGLRTEGYMIDFFGAGYEVAEKMDLLSDLQAIHYPIDALRVKKSNGTGKYDLKYEILRQLLDDRHFNFMRGDLERVLYERVKDRIQLTYGTTIESILQDEESVQAALSNGTKLSCDLLVGADGIHSKVRSIIFGGEERFIHPMGYQTIAYTFNRTNAFTEIKDTFDTITETGRQVSLYPIRGDRLATFFMFTKTGDRPLSHEQGMIQLREHFGDMEWVIPEIIEAGETAKDFYYDDVSQVALPQWGKGRVVLVGDSCGCVSLVAGQGSSLAMSEAYALTHCLEKHKGKVQLALSDYENAMLPQVTTIQRSARKFASYFFPETKWKLMVRDVTMRASTVPVIRNFMKFKTVRLPK